MSTDYRQMNVFHFADRRDALLVEGIWPKVRELVAARSLNGAFFERDWKHGPHVVLYYRADDAQTESGFREYVETYLDANPSRSTLSAAEYREQYAQMAWWEGHAESALTLAEDNSVTVGEPDADAAFWGGSRGLALARGYLAESSDVMADVIAQYPRPQRLPVALGMMLIWAQVLDPKLKMGMYCFRSHAEAVFATPAAVEQAAGLRDVFEQRYRREEAKLKPFAERILGGAYPVPRLDKIHDALVRLRDAVLPAFEAGRLTIPDSDQVCELYEARRGETAPGWQEIARNSSFHSQMTTDAMQAHMRSDPQFLAVRYTVNLLYANLAQLGVKPLERYQCCWLLARVIEEAQGFDDFNALD